MIIVAYKSTKAFSDRTIKLCISCCLLLTTYLTSASCFSEEFNESKLNLLYTVNIAKFVKWPQTSKKIDICISSQSKLYHYAKNIKPLPIDDDRTIYIKIDVNDLSSCEIIYWDDNSHPPIVLSEINKYLKNSLLITDSKTLINNGFNIYFFVRNLKVRFYINDESIKKRNYQISSKLLRLSKNLN